MVSVNCDNFDKRLLSGRRRDQGDRMPRTDIEDVNQRAVRAEELEREELGDGSRAEEWAPYPRRAQALGVVRVQVS